MTEELQDTSNSPAEEPNSQLTFRLPGKWVQLVPDEPEQAAERIKLFVEDALGTTDELAPARVALRERLKEGLEASAGAQAQSMFLCMELEEQTRMPVAITVYMPADFRISPAMGTDPDKVMDVFIQSLEESQSMALESMQRISLPQADVCRLHRFIETDLAEGAAEVPPVRGLVVDYWFTVPDSKRMVLVNFYTPLGDIPEVMLEFFDAIVGASRYVTVASAQSEQHA